MTPPPLAAVPPPDPVDVLLVIVGGLVFLGFVFIARWLARLASEALRKRQMRPDMVIVGGRVITVALIGFGALIAVGIAVRSENVAIAGIILATIVAAFGVQDLLRDYVSGYYMLLERHFRVGDRISFDTWTGTVTDVKLRVTILRSDDGNVIVVPNSELFHKPVLVHAPEAKGPGERV
jgi:small conductance mechanosensitive channel